MKVWILGVGVAICYGVCQIPVIVGIVVGREWVCRGVWIMIKFGHTGRITEHTLFIIGFDLCYFEVFLEGRPQNHRGQSQ